MKARLFSLMLLALMAFIPVSANAQSKSKMRELLSEIIIEMNKSYPMEIDDGMTVTSLALQQSYFVMNMTFDDSITFSSFSESEKSALKNLLKESLLQDEEMQSLMQLCAQADCDIKINIKDSAGEGLSVIIPCK